MEKLEDWARLALQWASQVLDANPPGSPNGKARRDALLAIDDVLHIGAAADLRPVQQFYRSRIARAVREVRAEQVSSGAMIWKMYNHGFIVKTSRATIGLDLVRGYGGTTMPDDAAAELARTVQVATISHWHEDHADLELCRSISACGGQILVPPDLFKRWSSEGGLDLVEMVPGRSHHGRGVMFEAVEGHHDGPPDSCDLNMYYAVTGDGVSLLHTGDHWINRRMPLSASDESFLDSVCQDYRVDILLVNRSPYQFRTIVEKFKPQIAISSHENELSHDIAARATYAASLEQLAKVQVPSFTLAWGEKLAYGRGYLGPNDKLG